MNETSAPNVEAQFESLNGGITMWMPHFANYLVQQGTDRFFLEILEMSSRTQDRRMQEHLHFLSRGVKSIDATALASALESLREPFQTVMRLFDDYQHSRPLLKQAEEEWREAAEDAKRWLKGWEAWARRRELERAKNNSLRKGSSLDTLIEYSQFELLPGTSDELDSPQRLRSNRAFFDRQVELIRREISDAYFSDDMPGDLSHSDLDRAIDNLMEHQGKVEAISEAADRLRNDWSKAKERYLSLKRTLLELLYLMPADARLALFHICRKDLAGLTA
jgi:hypothetical protein